MALRRFGFPSRLNNLDDRVLVLEKRAARIEAAAVALLADVRRRYPGEELRCPFMRELDEAVNN